MHDMVLIVSYFSFLLGFGVLVANMMKKIRIPDPIFLLLIGLACGPTIWKNPAVVQHIQLTIVDVDAMSVVPDFLRTLALVLIVFTGAFNLRFSELKKFSDISIKLAFLVVVLNTVALGIIAKFVFNLGMVPALLIGAIISGTDISVVVTFEDVLKKHSNILTILKMESIINSPLSVLIPFLFLDFLRSAPSAVLEPGIYISKFWLMIAAGVGGGIVIGLAVTKILDRMLREYTPLIIFSLALLTYGLVEAVGGSGMLAAAISGCIIGNTAFTHKKAAKEFHSEISDMLRIAIYTLLGAQVFLDLNPMLILAEILFVLFVFVVRPVFVTLLAGDIEVDYEGTTLLKWVAPRGISAAAMAPIAAVALGDQRIINVVFMVIFFSVLFSTITASLVSTEKILAIRDGLTSFKSMLKKETKEVEEGKDEIQ
ncbi:MAG: cation:proton antiporter [Methanocellales archaeon]|nr:cation:proton antiporter [Methanocellales archaeon]